MACVSSSTVWNCRGALPSTACATFRETRFVQSGLAVTRFRHVLIRVVGTYASREAGEGLEILADQRQGIKKGEILVGLNSKADHREGSKRKWRSRSD